MSQGALGTVQGIGAALSTTIGGFVVVQAGYSAAFLTLGAIAALSFVIFLVAMPEMRVREDAAPNADPDRRARAAISP